MRKTDYNLIEQAGQQLQGWQPSSAGSQRPIPRSRGRPIYQIVEGEFYLPEFPGFRQLEKPIREDHTDQPHPDPRIAFQHSKSVWKEWKSRDPKDYKSVGKDYGPDRGNPSGARAS